MTNVYATPQAELIDDITMDGQGSLEKAVNGQYRLDIGEILKEAWARTQGAKWTVHLAFILYILVVFVVMFGFGFASALLGLQGEGASPGGVITLALVQQVVQLAITMPLGAGLFMLGLRRAVDAPISATGIFGYFSKAIPLLVMTILMYLMLILGFTLLILPGIYLAIAYYMAVPLIAEKNLGPWQALETSRKAVTKKWFQFFGFMIVLFLINLVGMIPLGIGLIWTLPMSIIAYGILYRNMFGCDARSVR